MLLIYVFYVLTRKIFILPPPPHQTKRLLNHLSQRSFKLNFTLSWFGWDENYVLQKEKNNCRLIAILSAILLKNRNRITLIKTHISLIENFILVLYHWPQEFKFQAYLIQIIGFMRFKLHDYLTTARQRHMYFFVRILNLPSPLTLLYRDI